MNRSFFDLPNDEQKAFIRIAEDKLGLPSNIIEKDLWVSWLLEQLFDLPLKMAFKGGTSLSKVFGLINRFSEDVDVTMDYRNNHYDQCLNGNLRLIPDDADKKVLATDYRQMKEAGMFPVKPPEFVEIMRSLHELEERCNKTLSN